MRSLVATACVALALCLSGVASAEPSTFESMDAWCNVAELRPADTDFDRGVVLIGAADARLGAINNELAPLMNAARGLHAERRALQKKVDALREERSARANRENDDTRDVDARLARALDRIDVIEKDLALFESKSSSLAAEARKLLDQSLRLGRDADEAAAIANVDATKRKKASQIQEKTRMILRWHFVITKNLSGR